MRRVILGLVLAMGVAGAAQGADFIVVGSTEPAVARGQEVDGGARLPVGAGRSVTLMHVTAFYQQIVIGAVIILGSVFAHALIERYQARRRPGTIVPPATPGTVPGSPDM